MLESFLIYALITKRLATKGNNILLQLLVSKV